MCLAQSWGAVPPNIALSLKAHMCCVHEVYTPCWHSQKTRACGLSHCCTHTHTHAHVTKAICIILSVHSKHQPADMQLQLSQMQQVPQPTGTTYGQGMPTAGGSNNPAKTPIEAYCHLPAAQDRRYSNAYKNTYTMSSMHTISRAKMQVMVSHCSSKRSAAVQHCGSVEHPCTHIEVAACQLPP